MDIIGRAGAEIIVFRKLDDLFDTGFKYLGHFAGKNIKLFSNVLHEVAPGTFSEYRDFGH